MKSKKSSASIVTLNENYVGVHTDVEYQVSNGIYAVFLPFQVLNEAQYTHPYMDTYYHKRDRSLFLVLSSPHNKQLQSKKEWHTALHSNCGFRNYLEHVAHSIEDWIRDQEAKYQASVLASEVDKIQKEAEEASSRPGSGKSKGKGRERSKSPKKSPSACVKMT